jgi:prepilin-type N-terminal cleavage/methylation domain-containing protein
MRNKKGFTLVEVVTAIGILVVVVVFTGIIFKSSIESYRIAGANAEIIQNLQTITTQLDRDFSQIRRDGLLAVRMVQKSNRSVTQADKDKHITVPPVWMDGIYYFTTGDFQSWFDAGIRSNIARVYFGHDTDSLSDANYIPLNQCKLARDVLLLTPGITLKDIQDRKLYDCNSVSFVKFVSNPNAVEDYNDMLTKSILAGTNSDNVRQLMCENVGEMKIEWINANYAYKIDNSLNWLSVPNSRTVNDWPKALKFTFTLYDSKGILKDGSRFTHIVYLEN